MPASQVRILMGANFWIGLKNKKKVGALLPMVQITVVFISPNLTLLFGGNYWIYDRICVRSHDYSTHSHMDLSAFERVREGGQTQSGILRTKPQKGC
jgi:hypothetical protein